MSFRLLDITCLALLACPLLIVLDIITHDLLAKEAKELATLQQTDYVTCIAFSPDGKTLAAGGDDKTIKLWDLATGKNTFTFKGHSGRIRSVAFSPDGETLASGAIDQTVRLWDAASGKNIVAFQEIGSSVIFSPDGKTLAAGGDDKTIKLLDFASGKIIATLRGHAGSIWSVAFSPDGKTLVSGGIDQTIRLWDIASGKDIACLHCMYGVASDAAGSVAFNPDGKTFATGHLKGTIRLWDVTSGKRRTTLDGHEGEDSCVAFSPDGKLLASGNNDFTVKLWDVAKGDERATVKHHMYVSCVAFSPNGKTIASGSYDKTVKLWDVASISTRWGTSDFRLLGLIGLACLALVLCKRKQLTFRSRGTKRQPAEPAGDIAEKQKRGAEKGRVGPGITPRASHHAANNLAKRFFQVLWEEAAG